MIEYLEETHTYINSKGVIIPSVSNLVAFKFNDTYKGIPEKILKNKAEHGTKVHEAIEKFIKGKRSYKLSPLVKDGLEEFKRIYKEGLLKAKETEMLVDYKEKYAGRVDLITQDNLVVDYKTTNDVYLDKWSYQLGYYNLALGLNGEYGYVIHLPKGKSAKLIKVIYPPKEDLLDNLKSYEKSEKQKK